MGCGDIRSHACWHCVLHPHLLPNPAILGPIYTPHASGILLPSWLISALTMLPPDLYLSQSLAPFRGQSVTRLVVTSPLLNLFSPLQHV